MDNDVLIERIAQGMYEWHNNAVPWHRTHDYIQRTYRRYAMTAIRLIGEYQAAVPS